MKREVGLWIDQYKTVIVTVVNGSEMTREIRSNLEKHIRLLNGSHANPLSLLQKGTAEIMRDKKFTNHLDRYYEEVIMSIRDADAIWIFGPGEAKVELGQLLERKNLGRQIVGIDSAKKLTARQIADKVCKHYLL